MAHHAANLAVWWVFAAKSYGPVGRKTGGFHIFPEAFDEILKSGLILDGEGSHFRDSCKGAASAYLNFYEKTSTIIVPDF